MTIDERLDRLTDRHEALTQSVEPLLAAQRQTDERIGRVTADIDKLPVLMAETGQFINRLAHIAEAHDQRTERLEERHGPSAA
jgi:hypothetical protein